MSREEVVCVGVTLLHHYSYLPSTDVFFVSLCKPVSTRLCEQSMSGSGAYLSGHLAEGTLSHSRKKKQQVCFVLGSEFRMSCCTALVVHYV